MAWSRRQFLGGLAGSLASSWWPGRGDAQQAASAWPGHGVHTSLLSPDRRALTWFAPDPTPQLVQVGDLLADGMAEPHVVLQYASAVQQTYDTDLFTHRAILDGADPAQGLLYRIGSGSTWSSWQALRPLGNSNLHFCHFGDHAQSMASRAVVAGVLGCRPDLATIAGDLAYANGNQALWDSYFAMLEPLAAVTPVLSCPGNHERHDGSGQGYLSRITQPGRGAWYALD